MPPIKRYFHCSQELLADPEVWQLMKEFGDRSILTWLQILIYLERTNNQWRMVGDWLAVLSRSVRQSSANLRRQVGWMVEKGWLQVGEVSADGSPLLLKGSKWLKYNKTRETENNLSIPDQEIKNENNVSPPFRSVPFLTNKEDKIASRVKTPSKPTFTDGEWLESLKSNPAYQHINFDEQNGKMDAWLSLPQNRKRTKTRRFILNWLNRIERPVEAGGGASRCQFRVKRGNFYEPCGKPTTLSYFNKPMCQSHKEQCDARRSGPSAT